MFIEPRPRRGSEAKHKHYKPRQGVILPTNINYKAFSLLHSFLPSWAILFISLSHLTTSKQNVLVSSVVKKLINQDKPIVKAFSTFSFYCFETSYDNKRKNIETDEKPLFHLAVEPIRKRFLSSQSSFFTWIHCIITF